MYTWYIVREFLATNAQNYAQLVHSEIQFFSYYVSQTQVLNTELSIDYDTQILTKTKLLFCFVIIRVI